MMETGKVTSVLCVGCWLYARAEVKVMVGLTCIEAVAESHWGPKFKCVIGLDVRGTESGEWGVMARSK